jgi:hypothetical protein
VLEGSTALQVDAANGYSRAPSSGPHNQQGATVQALAVTVVTPTPPVIALTPASATFAAQSGGGDPPPTQVQVTNGGGGTLVGLTIGAAIYNSGQPGGWLNASLNGTTIALAAAIGSLPPGTYNATVPVSATGTTPKVIDVSLTLTTAPQPPVIVVTPPNVVFVAQAGGGSPASQQVQVTNGGGGTLTGLAMGPPVYAPGQPNGWLNATLAGTTGTVVATTGNLGAGTYSATVPLTAIGATAQPMGITFIVSVSSAASDTITIAVGIDSTSINALGTAFELPLVVDLSQAPSHNVASITGSVRFSAASVVFDSVKVGFGSLIANTANASSGDVGFSIFSTVGAINGATLARFFFHGRLAGTSSVSAVLSTIGDEQGVSLIGITRVRTHNTCIAVTGLWGDANGDNTVNIIDAQQIARASVGLPVNNPLRLGSNGDANGDTFVNIIDAQQIARFSVGLPASGRIATPVTPICGL